MRVYVSSTFKDLREHREAALRAIRRAGHEAVAMEEYTAVTGPPLDKVLADVARCDVYVGILAWNYGDVPKQAPAGTVLPTQGVIGKTSFTEWEYLQARVRGLERLLFVVQETAPWPPQYMNATTQPGRARQLKAFRKRVMQDETVATFSSPDSLASEVGSALVSLSLRRGLFEDLALEESEPSVTQGIVLDSAGSSIVDTLHRKPRAVRISLDTTWWSTRLYLLATLGREVGLRRIVVLSQEDLVGTVNSEWVRDRLRDHHPELGKFERKFRQLRAADPRDADLSDPRCMQNCLDIWQEMLPWEKEDALKEDVDAAGLRKWFGDGFLETAVEVESKTRLSVLDVARILDYPSPFVPVKVGRKKPAPVVLIEKAGLNERIARSTLREQLVRLGLATD